MGLPPLIFFFGGGGGSGMGRLVGMLVETNNNSIIAGAGVLYG